MVIQYVTDQKVNLTNYDTQESGAIFLQQRGVYVLIIGLLQKNIKNHKCVLKLFL